VGFPAAWFPGTGCLSRLRGVASAAYVYLVNPGVADFFARRFALGRVINWTLVHKYGFDALYIQGFAAFGRGLGRYFWQRGDVDLIDGRLVNGTAQRVVAWAAKGRSLQSGYLYHYAFAMLIGLTAMLGGCCLFADCRDPSQGERNVRMFADLPLLSLLIWTPVVGGLVVLWLGDRRLSAARGLALGVSLLTFVLSLGLWTGFDVGSAQMQFLERALWIPTLGADYALGVDGLSMPLIILTAFMTVFVIFAAKESVSRRSAAYMGAFLVMEGLMIGVFAALDALLFYVFWEAMLIPMFLIIGIWGGPRRIYATVKFFLFTFLGSVLMLVAFIYLYQQGGSFDVLGLQRLPLSAAEQTWIFLAFLVAFAVKVPMWPVHTWLPDAHVEAPTGGSVILAAITLKMGAYGFLRYALPIAPDAAGEMAGLMAVLSLIAVVYVGLVAMVQEDMKKLIAYSSIAHMGFVTLGFFPALLGERDCRWGVGRPGHGDDRGHGSNDFPWLHLRRDVPECRCAV